MKQTIITLLLLMAVGCTVNEDPFIVTRVQKDKALIKKYYVEVNDNDFSFHTDSLYQVGDTIK